MVIERLRRHRFLAIGLAISFLVILAACTPDDPQSTFGTAGPVAERQKDLFIIIFWVAVAVFVVVEGILVYAAIRFRRREGQGIPKQTHGHKWLEIGWTIAPAVVLAAIAVPTISAIFFTADAPSRFPTAVAPSGEEMRVKVTAHQWWWEFEYFTEEELDKEKADLEKVKLGELDRAEAHKAEPFLVTANELHIPVGKVVNLDFESEDVIHSFWVPKLAGKVDVIPTHTNTMWLIADEEGTFLGQCAEFCGIAHANMRFRVIAESEEEFDEWVANFQLPTIPAAGEVRALFVSRGCLFCHTIGKNIATGWPGPGDRTITGPDLTHFGLRDTLAAGIRDNTPENLTEWLSNPDAVKPGNRMKEFAPAYSDDPKFANFALNEKDIAELVAYLSSLKPGE